MESTVNLLVATLDLQLVRLVRGAMRAADAAGHGAACGLPGPAPGPAVAPRRHVHPDPVIEPRPHVRPEPAFEPRPTHRPEAARPPACAVEVVVPRTEPTSSGSPIQPPWKVLPWQDTAAPSPAESPRPLRRVKVIAAPPDMCGKGNVIDLFI